MKREIKAIIEVKRELVPDRVGYLPLCLSRTLTSLPKKERTLSLKKLGNTSSYPIS